MKSPTAPTLAVLLLAATSAISAQQQSGEIFGKTVDASGAVLPGVTVTVASRGLIQPRVTITSATGTYNLPELPVGTYSVTFELPGLKTVAVKDIRLTIGFRAQINATMELSSVQETVTISGASPLVDSKAVGTKSSFDLETLQNLPTARDPWVMLEKTPGIAMDRANVGGSQSGQQSEYVSRGSSTANNKWSIDGVDITDMTATGASPIYYDFDMLEEMQVTTGGADASQQTGGVGINLVTRGGTDAFKGSGRYYVTDDNFQSDNITDDLRAQGAGSGAPIQNIRDFGFEVGGPFAQGKVWYWGSYGTQKIKVGVVGFDKNEATDLSTLNNYNWKLSYMPFANNKLGFQNTWAEKVRNARDASDLRPLETTYRQGAAGDAFGAFGWITGPSPLWKASDQHVFNDKLVMEVQWAHLGNNFVLDFHEDALSNVQPRVETSTGAYARSFQQFVFTRPTNSLDVTADYFLADRLGGDHAFKFGYRWRSADSRSLNHWGGNAIARYTDGAPDSADIYRDGNAVSHLNTNAFYAQDSMTVKRLALNLGLRLDVQDDEAGAAVVPANPMLPKVLPSISFPGADAGVTWKNLSPRLGMTYDISGAGKTIANASYAAYFGQMAPGQLSGELAATDAVFVRYGWADRNGDGFVQAGELDTSSILSRSAAYDPGNPSSFSSPGRVDPNIKNDRTDEFIVGIDHELRPNWGLGASYIWRKYGDFSWQDVVGLSSADYRAVNYQAQGCPAQARCPAVVYYEPRIPAPSDYVLTNVPDRTRTYSGLELTLRKRMANRWAGKFSYAYNNAIEHWDSANAYEDPTNINPQQNGAQYAPVSEGSGIDNVYTNAKWLIKANGSVLIKYNINIAAGYQARQGYPFPQGILSPNRANSADTETVLLDPLGDIRLANFQQIDLRIDRTFKTPKFNVIPSMDIFNATNAATVLARRRNQNAPNANDVSQILSPRVIRFGMRASW